MTLRVYLDSSDYSTLSKPQLDQGAAAIRDRLVSWAASGEVEFRYSSAHISEMSPLEPQHTDKAQERAALLVTLCGRKTMVSIDEIMRREIIAYTQDSGPPNDVYSDVGDWFPPIDEFISPVSLVETFKQDLAKITRQHGANRAQRRAIKRRALKGNSFSPEALRHLQANQMENLKEVLVNYPMSEMDAKIIHKHLLGKATKKEAEEAFLNSLRDPTWMMMWFAKHHDKLNPVIRWVRGPAENVHQSISELAEKARQLRASCNGLGIDQSLIPGLDSKAKARIQSELLLGTGRKLAEAIGVDNNCCEFGDEASFARNAKGLTVCVNSAVNSTWDSLSAQPRLPKASDFVDVMHSIYAPYVDVFRTDGYMAPIIANAVKPYGTKVVGKLADLVATIELALQEKCQARVA